VCHIRICECTVCSGPGESCSKALLIFSSNIASGKAEKTVKARYKSGEACALQAGFTLAEMTVVAAIVLVVGSLSIPTLSRTIDISRLKSATQSLASAYQDTRIRATQDDTSY